MIIIPAGVSHKNITSVIFGCVGAYPEGQQYDLLYGKKDERPVVDEIIKQVKLPLSDPIFGKIGPVFEHWK